MNNNLIKFYLEANKLKEVVRTGWTEVGINSNRIESVAEHVYGCLVLAIGLDSEYNLSLDMCKVFKMLIIKELEKVNLDKEYTPNSSNIEDRKARAKETILNVTSGLLKQNEYLALIDEINECETEESKFVYNVSKIESDLQAKIYDLNGNFDLDKALEDVKNYGEELSKEILPKVKNASDGWIYYDRRYYTGDKIFEDLSKDIQNMDKDNN